MPDNFKVTFKTADGSLVMDRHADADYYFDEWGRPNEKFIQRVLISDGREKGVRVLSHTITKDGLAAIVEWLK